MSKFKAIMDKAISDAEHVDCDITTFRKGLVEMQSILADRIGCEPSVDDDDEDEDDARSFFDDDDDEDENEDADEDE